MFRIKKVSKGFKIHWNTLTKMWNLKGSKWLLSQYWRVKITSLVVDGTEH